jgi:opacity protein-like surface antigen
MTSVVAAAALALLVAAPATGRAEDTVRRGRFEVWLGGTLADPALDAAYVTRYSPTFGTGGGAQSVDSDAGQSLTVRADRSAGGEVGLGWSPDGRWGVRLSGARAAGGLSGANGAYSWSARFIETQPPDNLPRPVEVQQSFEWPDTEGRLRVTTVALGAFRRWEGRRAGGGLTAGVALVRASGELRSLGFTALHLGGHSTFFTQEFEVEAALDPSTVAAFHAGADVDLALARSWRLRLAYRYLRAHASPTPRVSRVVNADEILLDEPLSRIESDLALQPLRLDLSSSRLLLSVVFSR